MTPSASTISSISCASSASSAALAQEKAPAGEAPVIRRLEPDDAAAYRRFRLHGLQAHPEAFTSSFEEESLRPPADAQARLEASSGDRVWGAFAAGHLVGVIGLNRDTRIKCRHKALLFGMFVAPDMAGQGIGHALVITLLDNAKSIRLELIVLTVTQGNRAAAALYEKCGFKAFGTEPDAIRVNGLSFGKVHMYLALNGPTAGASPGEEA